MAPETGIISYLLGAAIGAIIAFPLGIWTALTIKREEARHAD